MTIPEFAGYVCVFCFMPPNYDFASFKNQLQSYISENEMLGIKIEFNPYEFTP